MSNTITEALETIETFPDYPEARSPLHFELPPELEAGEPPEARGLRRDEVRLMVSYLEERPRRPLQVRRPPRVPPVPATPSSSTPAAL